MSCCYFPYFLRRIKEILEKYVLKVIFGIFVSMLTSFVIYIFLQLFITKSFFTCAGNFWGSSGVCSKHGYCNVGDAFTLFPKCECWNGYFGEDCSNTYCYQIESTNEAVCNGHGLCIDYDTCSCDLDYVGSNCSTFIPYKDQPK